MIGDIGSIPVITWYLALGAVLFAAGLGRSMTARDRLAQIIGFNVMGLGSLVVLVAAGARAGAPDPSLTALAITGLVITVAFTGVGVALVRAIESGAGDGAGPATETRPDGDDEGADDERR
ncbi:hypothetical protein CJ204_04255 [Corynebacterium xerosis]|uniref:Sodium:proton antiporter n=1 Tax=Corynebacterium xerosis TaxID=1725 RepID=A0A2N6T070_9CORY|nr:NADH-quinone oxidoreductase subunit K [Corynebacterium xerosis]PMC62711.1 hypothetical protein CJ204_04255 [Corynebacterium xerosis]